jgi:hypothetical protein
VSDKRDNSEIPGVRLAEQAMSVEAHREGRKQQSKFKATAGVRKTRETLESLLSQPLTESWIEGKSMR